MLIFVSFGAPKLRSAHELMRADWLFRLNFDANLNSKVWFVSFIVAGWFDKTLI